jgi:putative intracellular protease/amidase
MKVAYVLYPDFTALDLVGPYEVISRWPDADVHFVARSLDPVDSGSPTKADAGTLRLALRVLLGDRPVRMATRMNSQAVAARLRRARRALSQRRANKRRPAGLVHK